MSRHSELHTGKEETYVRDIFSSIAHFIDPLDTAFSLGLCHLWRRKLVSEIRQGDRVLDICAGTGEVAKRLMKKVGPDGSLTVLDFCEEMLEIAKSKIGADRKNVTFVLSDVRKMDFPDRCFDAVTVAFGIRNVPDTAVALTEIGRVLKPGGRFLCLELTKPQSGLLLPFYRFYTFRVMPTVARIVTKTKTPYTYLPKSIDLFYAPEEFRQLMGQCGFRDVVVEPQSMGVATIYRGTKKRVEQEG